jgi:hypothetical protein
MESSLDAVAPCTKSVVRFQNKILMICLRLDFDQDVLTTDGKYFYALLNGKGLVKFTTG